MKLALVGGSGFIGTHFAQALESEFDFINLDLRASTHFPEKTVLCDVRDRNAIQKHLKDVDAVLLLAAEHKDNVLPASEYYDTNVQGMENVLESMSENHIQNIIFTSSVAIYGMNRSTPPSETTSPSPFNDYGKSKLDAENVLRKWAQQDETRNALIIRPTVVFGENNRGNVYNLLRQIHSGRFVMVGNGKNKKSMCYVGNLVAFMLYMLKKGWQGEAIYNYIDKPDLNMQQLSDVVIQHMGKRALPMHLPYGMGLLAGTTLDWAGRILGREFPLSAIRVKKFCATTVFDSTKAFHEGFEAPFSLQEGLKRTLRFDFQ